MRERWTDLAFGSVVVVALLSAAAFARSRVHTITLDSPGIENPYIELRPIRLKPNSLTVEFTNTSGLPLPFDEISSNCWIEVDSKQSIIDSGMSWPFVREKNWTSKLKPGETISNDFDLPPQLQVDQIGRLTGPDLRRLPNMDIQCRIRLSSLSSKPFVEATSERFWLNVRGGKVHLAR